MGKIISYAIVSFWLVMSTLFVKKEILPRLPYLAEPSYELMLRCQTRRGPTKMGIYFFNRRIGEACTEIGTLSHGFYRIAHYLEMNLPIPSILKSAFPEGKLLTVTGSTLITPDYQLKSFDVSVTAPGLRYQAAGQVKGEELEFVLAQDGVVTQRRRAKFNPRVTTTHTFTPFLAMPYLAVGKEWGIHIINPFTGLSETVKARVESKTTMVWQGKVQEVFEVILDYQGFQPKAWITPSGEILKEEILMPGLYLLREE